MLPRTLVTLARASPDIGIMLGRKSWFWDSIFQQNITWAAVFSGVHLYRLFIDDTGAGAARAVQAALSKVSTSEPLPLDSPAAGASEDGALLTKTNAVITKCRQSRVPAASLQCSPSNACRYQGLRQDATWAVHVSGRNVQLTLCMPTAALCSQAAKRWWTAARAARRWLPRRCRRRRTTTARTTSACRCSTSARCAAGWLNV